MQNLLLHICCAPCSVHCVESLRDEGIEPAGFWYNPNIHPFLEYKARRDTLRQYARDIGLELREEDFYGLRAFTAAVFGGIGSIPGAFLGGILLGIIETFAKAYISTDLSDAVVFAVLIIVLLVKPAGLLGKYVPEKV